MSQFSLYENNGKGAKEFPYLLDVQSELLSKHLPTRIVVPLTPRNMIQTPVVRLHIAIRVRNKDHIALFDQLASVESKKLGKSISKLDDSYITKLKSALDVLFFNYP